MDFFLPSTTLLPAMFQISLAHKKQQFMGAEIISEHEICAWLHVEMY
jgi:hypothetical protein